MQIDLFTNEAGFHFDLHIDDYSKFLSSLYSFQHYEE